MTATLKPGTCCSRRRASSDIPTPRLPLSTTRGKRPCSMRAMRCSTESVCASTRDARSKVAASRAREDRMRGVPPDGIAAVITPTGSWNLEELAAQVVIEHVVDRLPANALESRLGDHLEV